LVNHEVNAAPLRAKIAAPPPVVGLEAPAALFTLIACKVLLTLAALELSKLPVTPVPAVVAVNAVLEFPAGNKTLAPIPV